MNVLIFLKMCQSDWHIVYLFMGSRLRVIRAEDEFLLFLILSRGGETVSRSSCRRQINEWKGNSAGVRMCVCVCVCVCVLGVLYMAGHNRPYCHSFSPLAGYLVLQANSISTFVSLLSFQLQQTQGRSQRGQTHGGKHTKPEPHFRPLERSFYQWWLETKEQIIQHRKQQEGEDWTFGVVVRL